MIIPDSRFSFSSRARRPRMRLTRVLLLVVLPLVVAGTVLWQWKAITSMFARRSAAASSIEELWTQQKYAEINAQCEEILLEKPMDKKALIYNGFSYFYRGIGQYSLEEKIRFFDSAITNLRRAHLYKDRSIAGSITYVLGKAYHYKGKFYADLSIRYMMESLDDGYVGDDSYEYLGLAYSGIGNYAKSAEYFLKAVSIHPSDMGFLALSQAYVNLGDQANAEEYLLRTLNKTQDSTVEVKVRFLLGKLYFDQNLLPKAEDQYKKIVEIDPTSADAHFYLGEILLKYGQPIAARAEWRNAERLDPTHYGARLRLYN